MSATRFLGLTMLSSWLLAGRSSPKKIEVGGNCILNSDCNSPLLCTDGKCHDACHASIDCPTGQSCVKTNNTTVCQLPAEADCSRTTCSSAYVCASDLRCRTPCQSVADCANEQVCVTNVCADPNELVTGTDHLPQKGPGLAADGGTDAQAAVTGGAGGGGGPGGASGSSGGAGDAADGGNGGAKDGPSASGGASGSSGGTGDAATAGGNKDAASGLGGAGGSSSAAGDAAAASGGGTKDAASGLGGAGGSSGGATAGAGGTATHDAGSPDLPADRPADTAPPTPLDGGGSTVLTGCGKVTTQRYFCDDFESGLDNWHYATEGWGLTTTTFQSASHSVTDSPNGNNTAGAKSEITMVNSMDLAAAVSPIVTFWHRLAIASNSGNAYVDVSKDAGTTWTAVKTFASADNTSVWSFQQLSLASYVGMKIKLRVRLEIGTTAGDGWYLDDIEVREIDLPSTGVPAPAMPAPPQRYFFDDFESGLDNWHHATEGWDLDTSTSQSATHSVTDSPNGNYPVGARSEITMVNSANLTGAVSPVVTFWHKLDLNFDSTYVDASSDGGTTWTVVTKFDYSKNNTSAWSFQQLSLAPYAGKKVKLRFRLVNSNTRTGDGWHIDDVEIREAELPPGSVPNPGAQNVNAEPTGCENGPAAGRYFCEDFEAGLSSWLVAADGWNTVVATSQSPSHSVTDSPNGNYPVGAKSDITMASAVDLTGAVLPILTFWHKLGLSFGTFRGCPDATDATYVDASSDSGTTWTVLAVFSCANNTSVWSFQQLSLASYAGQKVKLRFRLVDNTASATADGWYLDDIKVRENEFVPAP